MAWQYVEVGDSIVPVWVPAAPTPVEKISEKVDVSSLTPYSYTGSTFGDAPDVAATYGKEVILPSGQTVTALYDPAGNLTAIQEDKNDVRTVYNPAGQVTDVSSLKGDFGDFLQEVAPLALAAGTAGFGGGLSNLIGGATGLSGAALNAATGATIGGLGSAVTGGDPLKGALLGGLGGYASGALSNATTPADLGMNSNLTMAQIESGLGTPGYGAGAQAASSGLFNPAVIGSGAYTQTSYPYDMADFLAADTLQLQGQVGNNLPAIEQNLVASGVDPLVATDVANQVALNPGMSQYDLTNYINSNFGGNIYDVNTAQTYPTSSIPGEGGLLNTPTAVAPTTAASTTPSTLKPTDISNLIKAGVTLAGLGAGGSLLGGGGGTGVGDIPTQAVPTNTPEYYQAIQQYYNTYMPEMPRDVATPLQQWYDSKYGA